MSDLLLANLRTIGTHHCDGEVGKEAADEIERLRAELAARDAKIEKLTAWISDLQSGMYVNCVYCGHRYGPGETTPVSMSDALKAHIAQCPEHPMSALRAKLAALRAEKVSQCGHPSSLMLRSAETGKALYCELCDERKRRRDAESMEEHYKARAEKAEAEAARLQAAIEQAPHDKHCVYFEISPANDCDCWKRAALAQEGEG